MPALHQRPPSRNDTPASGEPAPCIRHWPTPGRSPSRCFGELAFKLTVKHVKPQWASVRRLRRPIAAADLAASGESLHSNALHDPLFSMEGMVWLREPYLNDGTAANDPGVSPLFGDFAGLPPLMFQAGSTEMLLGEFTRAAARADAAGTAVVRDIFDREPHVFQLDPQREATGLSQRLIVTFVRRQARW